MQDSVKQDREKYIGGSDIPVIMNLSPFKTRYELLFEKAGYEKSDFQGNVFTEYGNTMEAKIRDYINMSFGKERRFKEGKHVREASEGEPIGTRIHTDGENALSILEIKTTSNIYESVDDYKAYLVQLLFYMMEEGKDSGLLAVYERPDDLNEDFEPERLHRYTVEAGNYTALIEEIRHAVEMFKEDLAKVKENPFISEADLLPAEIPDIASRILAFEYQLKAMKKIEKKVKEDKERLKKAMEAANVKTWKTPNGYRITLVADSPDKVEKKEAFDIVSFRKAHKELYAEYMKKEVTVKKGRAGYVLITTPKEGDVE